jgi:hypothetical protein
MRSHKNIGFGHVNPFRGYVSVVIFATCGYHGNGYGARHAQVPKGSVLSLPDELVKSTWGAVMFFEGIPPLHHRHYGVTVSTRLKVNRNISLRFRDDPKSCVFHLPKGSFVLTDGRWRRSMMLRFRHNKRRRSGFRYA